MLPSMCEKLFIVQYMYIQAMKGVRCSLVPRLSPSHAQSENLGGCKGHKIITCVREGEPGDEAR